jgi:hypothetical protein
MSDLIKQSFVPSPNVKPGGVKPAGEQVSKSLDHFWQPLVDFFKENETEKLMRTDGLDAAINFYEYKMNEMKEMFPESPTGKNINILG